ncbi:MAG: hypothetical protein DRP78_05985 [Candidatus Omnitrophota bacterium]|nr:MAG: hypothetical protein DRP78_05985 [Candidatus Omnitrophota bacterium]
MKKSIIIFITAVIVIIGIVWWGVNKKHWFAKGVSIGKSLTARSLGESAENEKKDVSFGKRGLAIKVYKVSRVTFEDFLPCMGTIKGDVTRKLNFEGSGIVKEINFQQGDLIRKGQVIASLKQDEQLLKVDYNQAKLKSAMVNLSLMEKKFKLYKQLYDLGAITKLKLSEVEAESGVAKYNVETAKVEVESAKYELIKAKMIAPQDCILSERAIEPGELVSPYTSKVIHVVEVGTVYAEIGVVESSITKIKIGQLARVYVDAYPDIPFDGIIDNIYPCLSEKTRTLPVEIKIDNSRRMLMPGMFARTEIVLFEKPGVISVPRISVQKSEGVPIVYVVDETTNTVSERLVETGYVSTDYIEITSGLKQGDLIAISNVEGLTSGTPVQITEIQVREI